MVEKVPCRCCLPTRTTHPSLTVPLLVDQRVAGMHQHMLGTHRGPNLISEAGDGAKFKEEKKKRKEKVAL